MERRIILSFDIEDVNSQAEHEEILISLSLLNELGVSGSFLLTGDKLHALVNQGRFDLLDGLAFHDIGFHSAHHSAHPTIPEYTCGLGWEQARGLLKERELAGVEALRGIFGIAPSTFGAPGDAWVPYISAFCADAGIKSQVYSPIEIPGFSPCEYAGIIDFGPPSIRCDPSYGDIVLTERSLAALTVVRIHPSTLVIDGWWDSPDYKNSKRCPPVVGLLKSADRLLRLGRIRTFLVGLLRLGYSFTTFGAVCSSIRAKPLELQDTHLVDLARSIERHQFPLLVCDVGMSLGQALLVLGRALISQHTHGRFPESMAFPNESILGSFSPPAQVIDLPAVATWHEFVNGVADAVRNIERTGQVSEHTFVGDRPVATTEMMYAAALTVAAIADNQKPSLIEIGRKFRWPSKVSLPMASRMVQSWTWPVLPSDFVMPQEVGFALSQLWSLRPVSS